jgi:hypothetical protein
VIRTFDEIHRQREQVTGAPLEGAPLDVGPGEPQALAP